MIESTTQLWRRVGSPRPHRHHVPPFQRLLHECVQEGDRGGDSPPRVPSRQAAGTVVIVGLGYVGWPLAVIALDAGFEVRGIDTNPGRLQRLASAPPETVAAALLEGRLRLTYSRDIPDGDPSPDVIVICVPTPWDHRSGSPDLGPVTSAAMTAGSGLGPGTLVVLESSTFPGTTEEIVRPILEHVSGLRAGVDFHLAYSPERIDPGNEKYDLHNTPKVVGGYTSRCTQRAEAFYGRLVADVVAARGLREAELSKLLENTYRLVNIGLVNELAVVAHEAGIDFWDAARCAATKPFGYQAFQPGPGVGGHCIPVDPLYLAHYVREKLGRELRFVALADQVNRGMARVVVERARALLGELEDHTVLLLGITYKADVPDLRETPALPITQQLLAEGATVRYLDPHVSRWQVDGHDVPRCLDLRSAAQESDLVILLQAHRAVAYQALASADVRVLDMRGCLQGPNVQRL